MSEDSVFRLGNSTAFGAKYPSPFFDLSRVYMPKTMKEVFKWCRFYFANNQLIFAAISKLAEYPVTDIVWDTSDQKQKAKCEDVFVDTMKIKRFMVMAGLDYFTYGNTFVSIHFPFKRFLICRSCKYEVIISRADYKWHDGDFRLKCKKCGAEGISGVNDEKIRDAKKINLVRWNPENMSVEYNDITGDTHYIYNVPNKLKKKIEAGHKATIQETPMVFLRSIKKGGRIELPEDNIYHFKRPSVSAGDMGFGMPLIMPCLRDLFQAQVLTKAREVIAMQHIIPLWVLFPAPQGNASPFQHMPLGGWKNRVEGELAKWKRDPNYIPIFPLPLGFQYIGGNGRDLTVTPELQELDKKNMAGLMVPAEFIWGGASYSGASFSLRMLENHFLSYMTDALAMLNDFVIPNVSRFLEIDIVKAGLQRLRMLDDVQQKNLVWQANQAGKVSDESFLNDLGYDRSDERRKIETESKEMNDMEKDRAIAQAEAAGEGMVIQAKYQAKAQVEGQKEMQNLQQELGLTTAGLMTGEIPPPEGMQQGVPESQPAPANVQMDPTMMAQSWAKTILEMPPEQRQPQLEQIRAEMPTMADLVESAMSEMQGTAVDMRPIPDQLPQRRSQPV